ncbi:MAG: hypothetical protein B1H13_05215 [Desulfobacteraceae bacterium 4484_190.3]|nr:MAG: hypothetical protein B1H13_05215 [Desulfobacteraceae bacterium 4484_190.3]
MRIGINLLFLLPGVVGGTETYAVSLSQALGQIDQLNEYIVFLNRESADLGLPRQPNFQKVICPVPARSRALRYFWEQFVMPLQAKKYQLDLLHSLGYVQPLQVPCKSVVTIHDLNFYNLEHLMPRTKRAVLRYFVTQSAMRVDHIITVSEFSKEQIMEILGIPEDKVTVTYNAVKKRPYQIQAFDVLHERYGLRRPYLLTLSSSSPHKNIVGLIRAFAVLKQEGLHELQLVVAGHPPRDMQFPGALLKNRKFVNAVVFTGYVPEEILPTLYAHAEVFVFPSLYEGFGIPILEAFQYGTSVACSNRAAIPEIAGNAAVYFDPTDMEEIAEVIKRLLADENQRKYLAKAGKEQVALFTWEETAQKTLDVYKRVLEG